MRSTLLICASVFVFGGLLLPRTVWGQAGSVDSAFNADPLIDYPVKAITIQSNGRILVGGEFRKADGSALNYVTRLNQDATLDSSFTPGDGPDGPVDAVVLQPDGKILIGGAFIRVNGFQSSGVARLNMDGLPDTNFVSGLSAHGRARRLALQPDGKVLVLDDNGLDRLLASGSLDPGFHNLSSYQLRTNAEGTVTTANLAFSGVQALADGRILISGDFPAILGSPYGGLVRLNSDGTVDLTFNAAIPAADTFVLTPDSNIIASVNIPNQFNVHQLIKLHPDGSLDASFTPSPTLNSHVWSIRLQADGKILVTGAFREVDDVRRVGVARFNVDGSFDPALDSGFYDSTEILALAVQGDQRILVGGYLNWPDVFSTKRLLRLNHDTADFAGRFEFGHGTLRVAENAATLVVPVYRSAGSTGTVTVQYATTAGTATPGSDFVSQSGTLTFAPGQTSDFFTVPIMDDQQVEGYLGQGYPQFETFGVTLSQSTGGATLGSQSSALVAILDDDASLGFEFGSFSVTEAAGQALLSLVRSGVTNTSVSVQYQTRDGTAVAPADYTFQSGTITFEPGEKQKALLVPLIDDDLVDGQESFGVVLSNSLGASIVGSNTTVFIADDVSIIGFPTSQFPVVPIVAGESDGFAAINVYRRGRTNNAVGVYFATSNLTATAGTDYVASSGTVNFAPGQTNATLVVPIIDDLDVEDLERFQVNLSDPTGTAVLGPTVLATVAVISDDGTGYPDTRFKPVMPSAAVHQIALCPGGNILASDNPNFANNSVARFTPDGSRDTSFQPDLIGGISSSFAVTADNSIYIISGFGISTAVWRLLPDGSSDRSFDPFFVDYTATFAFYPFVPMAVQADGKIIISAYPAPYYGYESATNVLNRLNVDGSYDLTFQRPNSGNGLSLAAPASALALQADGKLLIAAPFATPSGHRQRLARLTTNGEYDPGFVLADFDNAVSSISVLADGRIVVSGAFTNVNGLSRSYVARLNSDGSLDQSFVPSLARSSSFASSSISALVAQSDSKVIVIGDALVPGVARFGIARLLTNGMLDTDFRYHSNRVWSIALQGDGEVLLGQSADPASELGSGALVRLHNDSNVGAGNIEFVSPEYRVTETNQSVTLVVRRTGGSNGVVQVRYATISGTAESDVDYKGTSGLITFNDGEIGEQSISIPIYDDKLGEGDELFSINLGQPIGGAAWGQFASACVVIEDDDTIIEFADTHLRVGEAAQSAFLTVKRYGATNKLTRVTYATSNGSATAGSDYLSQEAILTFYPGEKNKLAVIPLLEDIWGELDETFFVSLYGPTGGAITGSNATAVVTIEDNDGPGGLDPTLFTMLSYAGANDDANRPVVNAVAVQSDGKILIGGGFTEVWGSTRVGIARLNRDGTLDHSFAPFGVTLFDDPGSVYALAIQPDGKIIIAGQFDECNEVSRWSIARLNPDGSVDRGFDPGLVATDDFPFVAPVNAVAIQSDGKVIIGGGFTEIGQFPFSPMYLPSVARLEADGLVDYAFMPDSNLAPAWVTALALQPDGKILLAGRLGPYQQIDGEENYVTLARANSDGSLDSQFPPLSNVGGICGGPVGCPISCPFAHDIRALALQSDGKIVVAGRVDFFNSSSPIIGRLNSDGSLDSTFHAANAGETGFNTASGISSLALQPDGKVLVGGFFDELAGVRRAGLARLESDGTIDLTFNTRAMQGGYCYFCDFFQSCFPPNVSAIAVQSDGNIVIGGNFTGINRFRRDGVARLYGGDLLSFRSIERLNNGQVRLLITVPMTYSYVLEASMDLSTWLPIRTNTVPAGLWEVLDQEAGSISRRFYRVRP